MIFALISCCDTHYTCSGATHLKRSAASRAAQSRTSNKAITIVKLFSVDLGSRLARRQLGLKKQTRQQTEKGGPTWDSNVLCNRQTCCKRVIIIRRRTYEYVGGNALKGKKNVPRVPTTDVVRANY